MFARLDFRLSVARFSQRIQASFYPYAQLLISNQDELTIRSSRYFFGRLPPQQNCPPEGVPKKGKQYIPVRSVLHFSLDLIRKQNLVTGTDYAMQTETDRSYRLQ